MLKEKEIKCFAENIMENNQKAIMEQLEKTKYVAWKGSQTSKDFVIRYEYLGFDDDESKEKYLKQGYGVYSRKEKTPKEEVISSLEIEDYLNAYINDSDNGLNEKIIMSNFLKDYIDKDLYVVEFIRDGALYLRVENEDDEILSKEFFLGEISEAKAPTIDDFELLLHTDMTINAYCDSVINSENMCGDDKICMIRDFIKHLNKGYYRMDAVDCFGNMCQLVMDQNTDEIIDQIYY